MKYKYHIKYKTRSKAVTLLDYEKFPHTQWSDIDPACGTLVNRYYPPIINLLLLVQVGEP